MSQTRAWTAAIALLVTSTFAQTNTGTTASATANRAEPQFKVRSGFRMQLAADGDLVEAPAALAFDERGRLYVAEMRDYPTPRAKGVPHGRIRLLEDSDKDGVFDTATVFAPDITLPSALACSRGGLFVASGRSIVFLADTNNDSVADIRRTLLNISGSSDLNPDQLPRGMIWGPDRRIHVACSGIEGELRPGQARGSGSIKLRGQNFSFDPLALQARAESGTGATGLAFDDAGHSYYCSPTAALSVNVVGARHTERNPFAPPTAHSVVLVPAEATARPLDCVIYRGGAFPTDYQGRAFLADPIARTIYDVSIEQGTVYPQAESKGGKSLTPFLTTDDPTFRPMQIVSGPDDALYIADLSRAVYPGGTPMTNSDAKATPDERKDRGRIWRLTVQGEPLPIRRFETPLNSTELAAALGSTNAWMRATAAHLLLERKLTNAAPLRAVLKHAKWPVARLEALRSLCAAGTATANDFVLLVSDRDVMLRAEAARLAIKLAPNGKLTAGLWKPLTRLAVDSSAQVRLQAALTLASLRSPDPAPALSGMFIRDPNNPWLQQALFTCPPDTCGRLFIALARQRAVRNNANGYALLKELARTIGLGANADQIRACLIFLRNEDLDVEVSFPLVAALAEGLEGSARRLPSVSGDAWQYFASAATQVAIGTGGDAIRADAVRVLGACIGPSLQSDDVLLLQFTPQIPLPMQVPLIRGLAQSGLPRDFEALTQRWHLFEAPERFEILNVLLEYDAGAEALLAALTRNRIPTDALSSVQINLLRSSSDESIARRAVSLFGATNPSRDGLLTNLLNVLKIKGSAARGRELFQNRCAACHAPDGTGMGPNVATMRETSKLQLLAGLVDPSRELADGYGTTVLHLWNGRTVWGVQRELNDNVVQLMTPNGPRRYTRSAIQTKTAQEWSLMPDNTSAGLNRQNVADLLEYIKGE